MPIQLPPLALLNEGSHDPVFIFALIMVLVLVAPVLMGRLGMPGVIGLIAAGIITGPHGLGLFTRDSTFELWGTVGLLYLMFIAGLEMDIQRFVREKHHGILFGVLTFAIPQVLGTLAGFYVLGFGWKSAVLLGSMLASHTLVSYPIANRLGLSRSRAVTTAIGGTLLTDTVALIILAVIGQTVHGAVSALFWVKEAVLMTICLVGILWVVPRIGTFFFRKVTASGEVEFVFVMAVAFLCAWLAKLAGIEPILGVFLAGLALNPLIPDQSVLMSRIQFVGNALFIPFFLISVGMLVNLRIFTAGWEAWEVALLLAAVAIAAKWLASALSGRLLSYRRAEANLVFGLSVNRAAGTLAVVVVGYRLGLFDDAVLNGAIFMVLVTNLVGSMITERSCRKLALEETSREGRGAPDETERILIPLANPQTAAPLMELAVLLRQKNSTEPLYTVCVALDGPDVEGRVEEAERVSRIAAAQATAAGVAVTSSTCIDLNVVDGIVRTSREKRITTIVIGWSGFGSAWQHVFGNVLDQILWQERPMVMACKFSQPLNTTDKVLLVLPPLIERHEGFESVIQAVKRLTSQMGAKLAVLALPETHAAIRRRLERIRPAVSISEVALPMLGSALEALRGAVSPASLVIVFSVRPHKLAWQPILNRLPREISAALPRTNLITLFPPNPLSTASEGKIGDHELVLTQPPLLTGRFAVWLPGETALSSAWEAMLRTVPELDDAEVTLWASDLEAAYRRFPLELAPGTVLAHRHCEGLDEPRVLLAVFERPFEAEELSAPLKVVLILLSPKGDTDLHIKTLARVAKLMQRAGFLEDLAEVQSQAELSRLVEVRGS